MLVLLAALLAASTAEDQDAHEEAPEHTAEASILAGGGTRGERRIEISARATTGDFTGTLGAAESEGPRAARREELLLGVQAGFFKGELRLVPGSEGLLRMSGELGVHSETLGLVLAARAASFGRTELRAYGARLEA